MKIVIDVPEKEYKYTLNGVFAIDIFRKAVIHGTPLPKGLISIDTLKQALCPHDEDYDIPCISPHNLEICLEQLVLEADKEVSDADSN